MPQTFSARVVHHFIGLKFITWNYMLLVVTLGLASPTPLSSGCRARYNKDKRALRRMLPRRIILRIVRKCSRYTMSLDLSSLARSPTSNDVGFVRADACLESWERLTIHSVAAGMVWPTTWATLQVFWPNREEMRTRYYGSWLEKMHVQGSASRWVCDSGRLPVVYSVALL